MQQEEAKKSTLHYLFFWTSGIATLFVWNSVLSLTDYFQYRFNPTADKYYPFFFTFGGFIAFLFFDVIMKRAKLRTVMMVIPSLLVVIFIFIFVLGELYTEVNDTKFGIMLGLTAVSGFLNSIMQTGLIRYSFGFSFLEISYYNTGTALVGVIVNVISLINSLIFVKTDSSPPEEISRQFFWKGLIYTVFQVVALSAVLVVFARYAAVYMKEETSEPEPQPQLEGEAISVQGGSAVIKAAQLPDPGLASTLAIISPYFFNMILIYAISLGVFPGFTFAMGLGWSNFGTSIQIILLIFNLGDMFGKYLYSKLPMKAGPAPLFSSLARVVFVAFVLVLFNDKTTMPELIGQWWVTALYVSLLAISNGYLTSALFSLSSERAPDRHKRNSGFLMTLGLLLGLTYGSLTILLGTKSSS